VLAVAGRSDDVNVVAALDETGSEASSKDRGAIDVRKEGVSADEDLQWPRRDALR